jgi:hypothetical protein
MTTCKTVFHVQTHDYRGSGVAVPWCETHNQAFITHEYCHQGLFERMRELEKRVAKLEESQQIEDPA